MSRSAPVVKINEKNVLVIIGPTAVGKSSLGVRLSFLFDAEIVSADSRQIYKYMDIGTAKPDKLDLASIPHHLIDEIRPDEDFNLSLFLRKARKAIDDIHKKGKLPILLGGTGQYIWALLEGWQVPAVAPNIELRSTLEKQARIHGNQSLYEELIKLDPGIAKNIDKNNIRRLIRAIEKLKDKNYQAELGNLTLRKDPPAYKLKIIGLNLKRETLYKIADNRVDNMIKLGWIEEVENLLEDFINRSIENGKRLVLVITGKGKEGEGVIKNNIISWLNTKDLRNKILAANYASKKHGGSGAIYILLRKI